MRCVHYSTLLFHWIYHISYHRMTVMLHWLCDIFYDSFFVRRRNLYFLGGSGDFEKHVVKTNNTFKDFNGTNSGFRFSKFALFLSVNHYIFSVSNTHNS